MAYTATELVASLRRRSLIPEAAADSSLATADLVALMSEEQQTYVTAEMMKLREEFFVYNYDFAPTTRRVSIPARAIGRKLKDVYQLSGNIYVPMTRIEPEQGQYVTEGEGPSCYFLEDDDLVFVGSLPSAARISYFRRRNKLIETEDAGLITAIDTGTRQVTISSTPTAFTTSVVYDFVEANPNFETLAMDQGVSGIASSVLTFSSALPDGLAVGDYVCVAGESPVPQVPVEIHPLLTQRTAWVALESLGFSTKAKVAENNCKQLLEQLKTLLSPGVEERQRKIVNRAGPGWRRRGR